MSKQLKYQIAVLFYRYIHVWGQNPFVTWFRYYTPRRKLRFSFENYLLGLTKDNAGFERDFSDDSPNNWINLPKDVP